MNYHKIIEDLDLKLNVIQYDIDNICDPSNFPLTKEKRKKLSDLYDIQVKTENLFSLVYDKINGGSDYDYNECEDPHIPSIHEDQWS